MKKVIIAISLGAMFLVSCGGGGQVEKDAKMAADLACKMQKNPEMAAKLTKEVEEVAKLVAKYATENQEEYAKAYAKAIQDCK